ncbi:MAG TPA: glycosyltransferase family 2 protein [Chryseosolibacter sp.]|nr:glycosyltransferase family 2 protein [Chryseosolibacter sp.]
MHKKLTASIVIYKNDPAILRQTVHSFLASTSDAVLYLIDNSPASYSRKQEYHHERIVYIQNTKNVGFGPAHNIALKQALNAQSDYHLVLNPDIYFEPHVVSDIQNFLDANPDIGLVMPKVLYPDGRLQPLCRLLPSPATLLSRRFLIFHKSLLNRINYRYEMHFTGYNKIMDVPFLSGCFMFLRVDALREVGLFDEKIFLYAEDIDLSRRIHQYYRTIFYPEVSIFHYHEKASFRKIINLYHHVRSTIKYFNKWGWFNDEDRKEINARIMLRVGK